MNKTMSLKLIKAIYNKTNGRCDYCDAFLDPFDCWEVEHMFPKSRGGEDELSNLIVACRPCNRRKKNRTVDEFRNYLIECSVNALHKEKENLFICMYPLKTNRQLMFDLKRELKIIAIGIQNVEVTFYLDKLNIPYKEDHFYENENDN